MRSEKVASSSYETRNTSDGPSLFTSHTSYITPHASHVTRHARMSQVSIHRPPFALCQKSSKKGVSGSWLRPLFSASCRCAPAETTTTHVLSIWQKFFHDVFLHLLNSSLVLFSYRITRCPLSSQAVGLMNHHSSSCCAFQRNEREVDDFVDPICSCLLLPNYCPGSATTLHRTSESSTLLFSITG
jgi:hypothetical protein